MVIMQITTQHNYATSPEAVIAMMADEVWLAEVARRAGAERWEVSVDASGSHVHAELPAPEKAKRFSGPSLVIDLDIVWQPLRSDDSASGRIEVRMAGMPASMSGTGDLAPATVGGQPGTRIDYAAEFSVNLPIIGRGLETAAAPYVRRVIDTQQDVGNDYLAGRLG